MTEQEKEDAIDLMGMRRCDECFYFGYKCDFPREKYCDYLAEKLEKELEVTE